MCKIIFMAAKADQVTWRDGLCSVTSATKGAWVKYE